MLKVQGLINRINASNLKPFDKDKAITGLMRIENNHGANFDYLSDDLNLLTEVFIWERTIEGFEFWALIHNEIVGIKE